MQEDAQVPRRADRYTVLFVSDADSAPLTSFEALAVETRREATRTFYRTDLQLAEYRPFFWGKGGNHGEHRFLLVQEAQAAPAPHKIPG